MSAHDVIARLLSTPAEASTAALVARAGRALAEAIPGLQRLNLSVLTLHPELVGLGFVWTPDGGVTEMALPHGELSTERFRTSPLPVVMGTRRPVRARLDPHLPPSPYGVCEDLRATGHTDYLALPLPLGDGTVGVLSVASARPGGLTDADVALLQEVALALATLIDAREARRVSAGLLAVWLGRRSAQRVLAGSVRRGDVEPIDAAVLYADLRGFTDATARLPPERNITRLDEAFEVMIEAVHAHGGEVLKLMGDAVLAMFPADGDPTRACRDATSAAVALHRGLHALPPDPEVGGLRAGVGLHVGAVLYGNVGGGGRLDVTAIGTAVNVAARLEGLCAALGAEIVASADVVAHAPAPWQPAGEHPLKGLPTPVTAYTLRAARTAPADG